MSLKIFELDPAKFPLPPGLPWQTALKMIKVELKLLTDFDLLLMIEKKTREEIYHSINKYAKANNEYMKNIFVGNRNNKKSNIYMQSS